MGKPAKDLTGEIFGSWTVLCRHGVSTTRSATWKTVCLCGKEGIVEGPALVHGKSTKCKSCANKALIDLTGKTFDKWTVLSRGPDIIYPNGKPVIRWFVRCVCGTESLITGSSLRNRESTQCKKCAPNATLPAGEANLNILFSIYKRNASKRGLIFTLSKDNFRALTQQSCYYCGEIPKSKQSGFGLNGEYTYNGIDRVDNCKPYILSNCVTCCEECNKAKMDRNVNDFLSWAKKLVKYQESLKPELSISSGLSSNIASASSI